MHVRETNQQHSEKGDMLCGAIHVWSQMECLSQSVGGWRTNNPFYEAMQAMRAGRPCPVPPDQFAKDLAAGVEQEQACQGSGIKFTSGKDLTEVVIPQYEKGFLRLMSEQTCLSYAQLGWGDAEIKQLMACFAYMKSRKLVVVCQKLLLFDNTFGEVGIRTLSQGIRDGMLPTLINIEVPNTLDTSCRDAAGDFFSALSQLYKETGRRILVGGTIHGILGFRRDEIKGYEGLDVTEVEC